MSRCITKINPLLLNPENKKNKNKCLICPQGPQGIRGPTGINGTNGTDGTDGKDGTNGTDGTDGITPVATTGFSARFNGVNGQPLIINLNNGGEEALDLDDWVIDSDQYYNLNTTLEPTNGRMDIPTSGRYILNATIQIKNTSSFGPLLPIKDKNVLSLQFYNYSNSTVIAAKTLETITMNNVSALLGTSSLDIHDTFNLTAGMIYGLRLFIHGVLLTDGAEDVTISILPSETSKNTSQWSVGQMI